MSVRTTSGTARRMAARASTPLPTTSTSWPQSRSRKWTNWAWVGLSSTTSTRAIGRSPPRPGSVPLRAADQVLDGGQELAVVKAALGQVVVGPDLQAPGPVVVPVLVRHDDHRDRL